MSRDLMNLIIETAYERPPPDGDMKAWNVYMKHQKKEHERQAFVWIEQNMDSIVMRKGRDRLEYVLREVDIYIDETHRRYWGFPYAYLHHNQPDHQVFYARLAETIFTNVRILSRSHSILFFPNTRFGKNLTWNQLERY